MPLESADPEDHFRDRHRARIDLDAQELLGVDRALHLLGRVAQAHAQLGKGSFRKESHILGEEGEKAANQTAIIEPSQAAVPRTLVPVLRRALGAAGSATESGSFSGRSTDCFVSQTKQPLR